VATFDFRSAATTDWADGTDSSLVSTGSPGSYADDVTVPEVTWDKMASCSPDDAHPVGLGVNALWPTGFVTYPSPDPAPRTESTSGCWDQFRVHAGWTPLAGAREINPHDHWLQASYPTGNEDGCQYQTYGYNAQKLLDDSDFFSRQQYFGAFRDQSLRGVKHESPEDLASGVCFSYDDDYIDDVLSVMAKIANAPTSIVEFA